MGLINNLITRFPNGVTNVNADDIFNGLKLPDPTQYHTFFDDFDRYLASNWTITDTGTGVVAQIDGNGGLITITNDAAAADNTLLQNVSESFLIVAGKPIFFKARLSLGDVVNTGFSIGLMVRDVATPLNPTDGIYFVKPDTSPIISVVARQTVAATVTAVVATLVNATFVELAFFYDGGDRVYYALNGTVTGYLQMSAATLPNTEMLIAVNSVNGAAGSSEVVTLDYIFCAQQR